MSRAKYSGRNVEIQRRSSLGESTHELAIEFGLTERSIVNILRLRGMKVPAIRERASLAPSTPTTRAGPEPGAPGAASASQHARATSADPGVGDRQAPRLDGITTTRSAPSEPNHRSRGHAAARERNVEIQRRAALGESFDRLAALFGISVVTVEQVVRRRPSVHAQYSKLVRPTPATVVTSPVPKPQRARPDFLARDVDIWRRFAAGENLYALAREYRLATVSTVRIVRRASPPRLRGTDSDRPPP